MKKLILLFLFLSVTFLSFSQKVSVIPRPSKIELQKGMFTLSNSTQIIPASGSDLHTYLQSQIQVLTKMNLSVTSNKNIKTSVIKLTLDASLNTGKEGYEMEITKNRCEIKSKTETGLFYGIQSLLQLLPSKAVTKCEIPCLKISDSPRFGWRGMHLDVSRHFFPKEFILKYIDLIALHKMNVFHWHLVDDQGWRIEIKKYPKLTDIGAWREDDTNKPWSYFVYPTNDSTKKLYGGFYTQSDIREIVKYAAERQITVVPEIEMPGHCASMIAAYPELSCKGKPWRKPENSIWEFSDPVCAGNELTFDFLENVLTEVIDLFPSKYIHIGGDECKKTTWKQCPKCQARMKAENFTDVEQLQSYLIRRIEKFLISKNRQLVGWDEILEGGLAPEATVMSWRGTDGGLKAAQQGHYAVMSPDTYCYFNHHQVAELDKKNGPISLEKVYSYNPINDELTKDEAKFILGGQGNLWSEFTVTGKEVEELVLPRMSALSEVLWTDKKQQDYSDFLLRLSNLYPRLSALNYEFYIPGPMGMKSENLFDKSFTLKFINSGNVGLIYYTDDATEPNSQSKLYKDSIVISKKVVIKAQIVLPSGFVSHTVTGKFEPAVYSNATEVENLQSGIKYTYYEGLITNVDSMKNMEQKSSGVISKFEFPAATSVFNFALKYDGYIQIHESGIYTFYTYSDDGSVLYIDGRMVINNNGVHGDQERRGQIALNAGFHKISAVYFQSGGGKSLMVSMQTPGGVIMEIPASVLKYK
ncbi:MAG: family 20 glycosylhydrolase [Bacteroidales bacterium]